MHRNFLVLQLNKDCATSIVYILAKGQSENNENTKIWKHIKKYENTFQNIYFCYCSIIYWIFEKGKLKNNE